MYTAVLCVLFFTTAWTQVDQGLNTQQAKVPPNPLLNYTTFLSGFHFENGNFCHQAEVRHYCSKVNEDFTQCILFDRTGQRLMGVEYIVSENILKTFPREEKALWHSHKFEIKNGLAVVPGLPEQDLVNLARSNVNTYGKTWHTFDEASPLPYGIPVLMMSFTRRGQIDKDMVARRDQELGVDSNKIKELLKTQLSDTPKTFIDRDVDSWKKGIFLQLELTNSNQNYVFDSWNECEAIADDLQNGGSVDQDQGYGDQDFYGEDDMYGDQTLENRPARGEGQGQPINRDQTGAGSGTGSGAAGQGRSPIVPPGQGGSQPIPPAGATQPIAPRPAQPETRP